MKNLVIKSELGYNALMHELKKKPSLSKQVEYFLNAKENGSEYEKRFAIAIDFAIENNLLKYKTIFDAIDARYKGKLNANEKFVSYFYMSQIFHKLLQNVCDVKLTDENKNVLQKIRVLFAEYRRAELFQKEKDENGCTITLATYTKDEPKDEKQK